MGRVGKAIEATGRSLGQQEGEWKAAIGELQKKAKHARNEVSGLQEVLANFESKHEKLREIVATQGDELAETRRQNLELRGRLQRLEEENRLLRETSEGLEGQLARVEAGQQREVARLRETKAASGSKVKDDLSNVQGELGKMKEEIRWLKMITARQFFPTSVKKGETSLGAAIDVPDRIIAHWTRECGGNVHDRHVVEVTCGSFEKETQGANPHSGALNDNPYFAAKNAADLKTGSEFLSAYRDKKEDIAHTRNNWVCCDFKERRIVPTHYTNCPNYSDSGGFHVISWLVETSTDGENWQEVARDENNKQRNSAYPTGAFAVAGSGECCSVSLWRCND
jgi:hypothetical protein